MPRELIKFETKVEALLNLNNGLIAVGLWESSDNLAIVNTADWSVQSFLFGHTWNVNSLVMLSDGHRFASGSWDNSVIVWAKKSINVKQYKITYLKTDQNNNQNDL